MVLIGIDPYPYGDDMVVHFLGYRWLTNNWIILLRPSLSEPLPHVGKSRHV
jgi:hypothetical protein